MSFSNPDASDLRQRRCRACEGDVDEMSPEQVKRHLKALKGWEVEDKRIFREFRFKDYYETMSFVNAIAWIANLENHHPDISFGYKDCRVSFTTHAVGGLTENDFIMAAKVDALLYD